MWDKTLPLDSKVGEYVNVARKKGSTWYVAGMTNWMPRDQHIRFDFLDKGREYVAEIVSDGVNADKVGSDYVMEKKDVHAGDELNLRMMPGGETAETCIRDISTVHSEIPVTCHLYTRVTEDNNIMLFILRCQPDGVSSTRHHPQI